MKNPLNTQISKLFVLCCLLLLASCSLFKSGKKILSFTKDQSALIMANTSEEAMRVFKINNFHDSLLLRKKCLDVIVDSEDQVLQIFVKRLLATVQDSMSLGVGIAAPQVGILKNIIWVQRFDKEAFPFEVYLNPKIVTYSDQKQDCMEGCLSIPDKQAVTKTRANSIQIQYNNMEGDVISETVKGFTAVIFQHEIDHLNGILFIDHLEKEVEESNSN